jgi:hypothetical protein
MTFCQGLQLFFRATAGYLPMDAQHS